MIVKLHFLKHINVIAHIDIAKMKLCARKRHIFTLVNYLHIRFPCRDRIIISIKRHCIGSPALKVKLCHLISNTVMHVDRTIVKLAERLTLVHLCDFFSAVLVQKLIALLVNIAHGKITRRELTARPRKFSIVARQFLSAEKYRDCLAKIRKQGNIIKRQRDLRCCRTDMRQLNNQIILIDHSIFTASLKQPARLKCNVLVKRLIVENEIVAAPFPASSGTPCLLPE